MFVKTYTVDAAFEKVHESCVNQNLLYILASYFAFKCSSTNDALGSSSCFWR